MKKLALLVDGGCLRAWAKEAKLTYECAAPGSEELFRVLYYDCEPFTGSAYLPLSGTKKTFTGTATKP